jgi:YD repeat-containing protein
LLTDANNNSISLTYDGSGNPVTLTDTSGRTVTLTYDGYGSIGSMSDSTGTIATYGHWFWGILTGVTYPDGSQFNFAITLAGNSIMQLVGNQSRRRKTSRVVAERCEYLLCGTQVLGPGPFEFPL